MWILSFHFLISQDPKPEVVWQLVKQLVYEVYYTRYQVFFFVANQTSNEKQ